MKTSLSPKRNFTNLKAELHPATEQVCQLIDDEGHIFVGRYELLERLNAGGQATVYRARDRELQRDVALKVGHHRVNEDSFEYDRVLQEGAWLARIEHPHLARVFDCGVDQGIPYLVMEFVPGMNLQEYVQRHSPGTFQVRRILEEVSSALSAAHRIGVLHLDLKPENVMVTTNGHCKLIDFGLARWLSTEWELPFPIMAGTRGYMSPEQLSGQVDTWSEATDVFGLGAILYFLLLREPPFPETTISSESLCDPFEFVKSQLRNRTVNQRLAHLCQQALAEDPQDRFHNVDSFRKAVGYRQKILERTLGSLSLVVGILLMGASLLLNLNHAVDHSSWKNVRQDQYQYPRPQVNGTSLNFHISTPPQISPQVILWTPNFGIQEIRQFSSCLVDGKTVWSPHSRKGKFCTEIQDDVVCLLIFAEAVSTQCLNSLPLVKDSSLHSAGHPSVLVSRLESRQTQGRPPPLGKTWTFSSAEAPTEGQLLPNWAKRLQESLRKLSVPYTCLLATRGRDPSTVWEIDVNIDFSNVCHSKSDRS